jgi:hypothetical protein
MPKYVGLDVHSKVSVFVIQDEAGRHLGEGKILTNREGLQRMRDDYGLEPGTEVALESGTIAFHVADLLSELGLCPTSGLTTRRHRRPRASISSPAPERSTTITRDGRNVCPLGSGGQGPLDCRVRRGDREEDRGRENTAALIDPVIHHAEIIPIEGQS